jgi:hypothetical protein
MRSREGRWKRRRDSSRDDSARLTPVELAQSRIRATDVKDIEEGQAARAIWQHVVNRRADCRTWRTACGSAEQSAEDRSGNDAQEITALRLRHRVRGHGMAPTTPPMVGAPVCARHRGTTNAVWQRGRDWFMCEPPRSLLPRSPRGRCCRRPGSRSKTLWQTLQGILELDSCTSRFLPWDR